jgi:death-on-curing protein
VNCKIPFVYPSYEAILESHDRIIQRTGGKIGMVSPSNLMYILETVQDVGEHLPEGEDVKRKAGYLIYNTVSMHPFLDGNKRTAFEVTKNFLRLNGWLFEPKERDAFRTLVSIASGEMGAKDVERWVGKNLRRVMR